MARREEILESAQVLLMTHDVCHAWLMSNLAKPVVKEFLRSLSLVVLDEAHTLEGVFGSNFAFLFRTRQS
jgi:DEAD/DEAH box helicase domain-containing protein